MIKQASAFQKQESCQAPKTQVSWPNAIPLVYKKQEYEAVSVACGPSFTFAIGRIPDLSYYELQPSPCPDFTRLLRQKYLKILKESGDLNGIFELKQGHFHKYNFQTVIYNEFASQVKQEDMNALTNYIFRGKDHIEAGDLENFILGFQQDYTKLFLFGKAD